jgi:membrane peptidoglycan carboxypeptidase
VDGTGTAAEMSDDRPEIGKTGTTTNSKSAFFIGAIPQWALSVGIFTQSQDNTSSQSLTALGGGGFGGTWPAAIWHTFAESAFAQLPIEQFQNPVFTGAKWVQVAQQPKKKPKHKHNKPGCQHDPFGCPTPPPGHGHGHGPGGGGGPTQSASPTFTPPTSTPTHTVGPTVTPTSSSPTNTASPGPSFTPTPGGAAATTANATQAGLALGGILTVLPGSLVWARVSSRRRRRRRPDINR